MRLRREAGKFYGSDLIGKRCTTVRTENIGCGWGYNNFYGVDIDDRCFRGKRGQVVPGKRSLRVYSIEKRESLDIMERTARFWIDSSELVSPLTWGPPDCCS